MSEIVDSGHCADKSNFSQTFNLLSQYLKENGTLTFRDLTLGGTGTGTGTGTGMTSGSMDLFQKSPVPQAQMQGEDEEIPKEQKQKQRAQMTIFYGGQVMVVDNFPADKATEVMKLAAADDKLGTQTTCFHYPFSDSASDWITKSLKLLQVASTNINMDKQGVRLQPSLVSDLPIARKASLARFLEKRKERLKGKAPYQSLDNHGTGSHSKQAWLGLAATESGGQFQPQS